MMTAKAILALKCGVLAFGCGTDQTPAEESVSSADTVPNPCEALTPAAIQASIDRLNQARAEAQLEYDAFYPGGSASSATQRGLEYITQARDAMVYLQTWLHDIGLGTPYVSNTSAAGGVFEYAAFHAAEKLAYGEWWEPISAIYNNSDNRSVHGKTATELSTLATAMLADISGNGIRCYMRAYFPLSH